MHKEKNVSKSCAFRVTPHDFSSLYITHYLPSHVYFVHCIAKGQLIAVGYPLKTPSTSVSNTTRTRMPQHLSLCTYNFVRVYM